MQAREVDWSGAYLINGVGKASPSEVEREFSDFSICYCYILYPLVY